MTSTGLCYQCWKHAQKAIQPGRFAALLVLFTLGCAANSSANDAVLSGGSEQAITSEQPAPNAVTGTTGAWSAEVTPDTDLGNGDHMPVDQQELLTRINAYMQTFNDLEGKFVQTNPDNGVQKGKFYVLRPGKMRFDYARPSRMRIVSDGEYLSIEDHDLETVNRYPLESTPFRMLLMKEVQLQKDARIISLSSTDTGTTITLADKTGQSAGQIQLFFSMPEMALKEWVITDAQGLHTRIEITNLSFNKKLAANLFKPSQVGLGKAFGEN